MARQLRNAPLSEVPRPRVSDPETQRALDALTTPLAEIQQVAQQFAQPDAWRVLQYSGSWTRAVSLQRPEYCSELGNLLVRGSVVAGATPTPTIAVLPPGYRVPNTVTVPASCFAGGSRQFVSLDLQPDGRIVYIVGPALVAGVEVHMNFRVSLRP